MITSNTAKIMGIKNVVDTLGKGDWLDMRTNVIEHAYIQGRHINLNDKYWRLCHVCRKKYSQPDIGK